jgi:hypothetical protein
MTTNMTVRDGLKNALTALETLGYTAGGDIHDDLAAAIRRLDRAAMPADEVMGTGLYCERTLDEVEAMLRLQFPADDPEDIQTYIWGPDDPEDYFAKMAGDDDILVDYREFREKQ